MWVARIKFDSSGTLIGSRASKFRVNLFGFPLFFYYEKKWIRVHIVGTIFGKVEDKESFIKDLEKEKRFVNFEINEDFFVGTIKEPIYARSIYNKDLIHIAPAFISEDGFEIITIGCFQKNPLTKAIKTLKRKYKSELLFIQQKKIKSISIVKVRPELTRKQKEAIELAIKNGYYHSPRKIDVKKLAKLAGLSFSTYQVHLRKAEEKLIPYFFE